MVHYRVYFMSGFSGRIDRAEDVDAADDQEAIKSVEELGNDNPIEIWCGTRKVHRIDKLSAVGRGRYRAREAQRECEAPGETQSHIFG